MKYKKFYCGCGYEYVEIDTRPIVFEKDNANIPFVGMTIFRCRSERTGKRLKHPVELGTVMLTDIQAKKFINHFKELK